jgi:hypothetical protein
VAVVTCLLLAQPLFIYGDGPDPSVVRTAGGDSFDGTLVALSEEKLVLIEQERQRSWPTADLIRIDFPLRAPARLDNGSAAYLANGDRLKIRPIDAGAEILAADWGNFPLLQSVEIPLATVKAIAFEIPNSEADRQRLDKSLLGGTVSGDVLFLANGDRARGEFLRLDKRSLVIDSPGGEIRVEREGVQALRFSSELISFPQPETPLVMATLIDGSRLTGRSIELNKNVFRFDALFGDQLKFPLAIVSSIQFLNTRAAYLSDLDPLEYRFTPFLSYPWELRRDRSVGGGALLLRSAEFAKGLGMHSRCEVTYSLKGRYRLFHAIVGIDDSARGKGNASISVKLDGRTLFHRDSVAGDDPALQVGALDVAGGDRLTLSVDFGQFGDVGDRVNWCDAVVVE